MAGIDHFTDRARQAMDLAQSEVRRYKHDQLGTEHLLLALTHNTEGAAARALAALGVEERQVRDAVESVIGPGTSTKPGQLGLAPRAQRSLELAVDEARQLKHDQIGTEHLLVGILREGDNVAVGVLSHLGVSLPDIYEQLEVVWQTADRTPRPIRRMVEVALRRGRNRATDAPTETKGNVITCRLTDRDLAALDALIEAGIRTSRSEAASWLISAGIDAHKDLFDKLHATIDQIRQLRADAQAIMQPVNPAPATDPPGPTG
jgi:ATP-dependent Clp protease ATP-binding subunit ClpA